MLDTQSCQYSSNEMADTTAKSALCLPITNMKRPARELIPCVSKLCLDEWQDIWDYCEGNKLHSIYPTVGIVKHSKIFLATIPSCSTVCKLVILVSLTQWWWLPNPSNLRNSTHSKTHISGMCQLEGHSWKNTSRCPLLQTCLKELTIIL